MPSPTDSGRDDLVIRFVSWLALLCSLTTCRDAPSPIPAETPAYEFVDLTDDFVRF
jgi:hypothetical protein